MSFFFHAVRPFDELPAWHIENAEASALVTFFAGFFVLWGMPFFFTMAGATSWFSLRRRSPSRYIHERVTRLLIPFIIGAIVLTPFQAFYELRHNGWWQGGSIVEFVLSSEARAYFYTELNPILPSPETFSNIGYHLWFVGFLFCFALLALPVFLWLKRDAGRRLVDPLARLAGRRGGLLVFVIPLMAVRFLLYPFFPEYTGWSDFVFVLLFFIFGYILIADVRFIRAVRRDWLLHLILGIACTLYFFSVAFGIPVYDWLGAPGTSGFFISHAFWSINGWCWTMVMLYVGIRFLDYANQWLQYGRKSSYAFFFFHQPVIIFFTFYVVQWEPSAQLGRGVGVALKLLVVVLGSLLLTLGFVELIKRTKVLRPLFGMKTRRREPPTSGAG